MREYEEILEAVEESDIRAYEISRDEYNDYEAKELISEV